MIPFGHYWLDVQRERWFPTSQSSRDFLDALVEQAYVRTKSIDDPKIKLSNIFNLLTQPKHYQGHGITIPKNTHYTFSEALDARTLVCRGLTAIYLTIGEQLELPLHAVEAPNHVFVRWKDTEQEFNFEARTGNVKSNEQYVKEYNIHPLSLERGAYLRTLSYSEAKAFVHYSVGVSLHHRGQYDEALEEYTRANQFNPQQVNAWSAQVHTLHKLGRSQEGLDHGFEALYLDPNYAFTYHNIGETFIDMHLLDDAIAATRESIKLKPEFAKSHFNLGRALYWNGQKDEGIAAIHKAFELDPILRSKIVFRKTLSNGYEAIDI